MERPILFSTAMVKAILEGRKTQTRRVIKPSTIEKGTNWLWNPNENIALCSYQPGDILWVKEKTFGTPGGIDNQDLCYATHCPCGYSDEEHAKAKGWRPSIHMPREAARIFLKVTNVKVERLQDITEEDAKAEGVLGLYPPSVRWKSKKSKWLSGNCSECGNFDLFKGLAVGPCAGNYENQVPHDGSSIGCTFGFKLKSDSEPEPFKYRFRYLWNEINLDRGYGWNANPWVWVIEFEKQ